MHAARTDPATIADTSTPNASFHDDARRLGGDEDGTGAWAIVLDLRR